MQRPDAILIIGGLRGDSAFVPDMTRATVGVSHGMRSVTLAVHQHSALLGAGSLFQKLGICKFQSWPPIAAIGYKTLSLPPS